MCVRLSVCACVRARAREREEKHQWKGDKRGKSENIALKRSSKGFLFLFTVKKSPEKNCASSARVCFLVKKPNLHCRVNSALDYKDGTAAAVLGLN